MLIDIRNLCRKVIFKITGINSINAAINPMNYLEKIVFEIFLMINKKQIFSGKFKSLNFIKSVRGSEFSPKYFGTYENELDPYFNLFSGSILIDIGCDDGYYSIGLLKSNYVKQVYAFEINEQSINNLLKNIELNLLESGKLIFEEKFVSSFESIAKCFNNTDTYLIKCDIEGGEYPLFSAEMIEAISDFNCSLIIETHINSELEEEMIKRFESNSFKVKVIHKVLLKNYSERMNSLKWIIANIFRKYWLNEHRPEFNRWIVVTK